MSINPNYDNALKPYDYQIQLKEFFRSRSKTWKWFEEADNKAKEADRYKSELLKHTYRLDVTTHGKLYEIATEVCAILEIDAVVTLYQEYNSTQLNAGISIIGREAHIVMSGSLISLLTDAEMKSLLAHELSHYLFLKIDNGQFETTQRIVLSLANDPRSENAIIETARIFQLYLELFCDAGSLKVCQDHHTVIRTLVKLNTGIAEVNAESYLQQAEEILSAEEAATSQHSSHPEAYIRSVALKWRAMNDSDQSAKVKQLIEGELDLNRLDIFTQVTLSEMTRELLHLITRPKWMNSSMVRNLCVQFFDDFQTDDKLLPIQHLADRVALTRPSVKNYLCYVLLDFAKVDESLEEIPMGYMLEISELLGLSSEFEQVIRKELKMTVRDFKLKKASAMSALQHMKENSNESIYNG